MKPCGPGIGHGRRGPCSATSTKIAVKREDDEREDEHVEHGHLHVVGFDLLAQVFGRAADHEAGDEDRQDHEDQHAVEAGADAAEDDFAEHDVDERNHAAERREAVVHAVDRAATGVGGDGGEERGLGDAEADFLAFHVAAGRGGGARLCRAVNQRMRMRLGPVDGRRIRPQTGRTWPHSTAQPWPGEPVMRPSV